MPKTHVRKSVNIKASPEKIFKTLSNFNLWKPWSPWLICEPEAKVTVADDAKFYEWEGTRIGAGNMKITDEQPNLMIKYDLTFLKPWKSTAKVRFELEASADTTRVVWVMDSSLPFFMFWMKKSMEAFIGMDFDRGLNMLKEYVEDGVVKSKLEFLGTGSYPGCDYIGINTSGSISETGKLMTTDFQKLWDFVGEDKHNVTGHSFSIYHKWDMVKQRVSYTAGIPLNKIPDNLPEGIIKGSIPATPTYTLRHVGPYLHLGNAWSTLVAMQRAKEFKPKKGFHPFETYPNLPGEVSESELMTDIHFGVKS